MFPRAQEHQDIPSAAHVPGHHLQVHQTRDLSHICHSDRHSNVTALGHNQWNHGVRPGLDLSTCTKADNHVDLCYHASCHSATASHLYSSC